MLADEEPTLDAVLVGHIILENPDTADVTEAWLEAPLWREALTILRRAQRQGQQLGDLITAGDVLARAHCDVLLCDVPPPGHEERVPRARAPAWRWERDLSAAHDGGGGRLCCPRGAARGGARPGTRAGRAAGARAPRPPARLVWRRQARGALHRVPHAPRAIGAHRRAPCRSSEGIGFVDGVQQEGKVNRTKAKAA
jgi:hypothetical protein